MKFELGKLGGENFVGFSKSSCEISHYFFVWEFRSNILKYRVCWNKCYYKKYITS